MSDRGNSRWLASHGAAALLIAAPILVLFAPVLCADRSLAMRDAAHFYHPLLKWTTQEWAGGSPPLWNPQENTGMPLLADASSSLFYPGRLLLFAPLDFAHRYNLYVAGHVFLAALGSYLLARHWQASPPAAACAALAYACGGSVLFQHSNIVFLVGAAWLPFAAWATDSLLVRHWWPAAPALAVVLALMVLGGDPQMAYHVVLMGGLYCLLAVPPGERPARAVRNIGWMSAAAALGAALAAVQVLPSLEAAAESDRAYYDRPRNIYEAASSIGHSPEVGPAAGIFGQPDSGTHHERLYDFSLAPWRLIECLWPNVGGRMFPSHRRWLSLVPAEGRIWTPSIYFGLIPLLLAVSQWRLWRAGASQAWLSWLLLLFTLGSFGWYGLGWCVREFVATALSGDPDRVPIGSPVGGIYWLLVTVLPGYVSFRYPAKLLVVAALAASQLSARGFDAASDGKVPRLLSAFKAIAISSVVLLSACSLALVWLNWLGPNSLLGQRATQYFAAQGDPSLGPFDWRGCQRDVCLAFLQAAVVGTMAHWILRRAGRPWWLAALIAVDLVLANYWLLPTAPAEIWRREPAAAAAIYADSANPMPRVFRASLMRWRAAEFAQGRDPQRLAQIATWERDTLFPKYGLPFGISLVESYGSLKPADYESLLLVAREQSNGELPHPAVLRLLGTQYVVAPQFWQISFATPVPEPANIELPKDAALWRVNDPLPRAWIVHQVEALPTLNTRQLSAIDERTRDVLFPRTTDDGPRLPRDFRNSAVIETDLTPQLPAAREPAMGESCRIVGYDLHRAEIEATLAGPGLVVLSDLFAPGWIATVETAGRRQSVPIVRTNRVCRGVLLPAGAHRLEMVYQPARFCVGAWISGLGWFAVLAGLAIRAAASARTALRAGVGGR